MFLCCLVFVFLAWFFVCSGVVVFLIIVFIGETLFTLCSVVQYDDTGNICERRGGGGSVIANRSEHSPKEVEHSK